MTRSFVPFLAVTCLTILLLGCHSEEGPGVYEPGSPYEQRLQTSGDRVIIEGADGSVLLKMRRKRDELRVYDDDMKRVGAVIWEVSDAGRDPTIRIEPFVGVNKKPSKLTHEGGHVFEFPGYVRVERVDDGWAVFTTKGRLLGYVSPIEKGGWAIRDDYSSKPRLRVAESGRVIHGRSGAVEAKIRVGDVAGVGLLVATFSELEPLARVALSVLFERRLATITTAAAPAPAEGLQEHDCLPRSLAQFYPDAAIPACKD